MVGVDGRWDRLKDLGMLMDYERILWMDGLLRTIMRTACSIKILFSGADWINQDYAIDLRILCPLLLHEKHLNALRVFCEFLVVVYL